MNILNKIVFEPFEKSLQKILAFLPSLLTSLLLLIVGIISALLIKIVFTKVLRTVGLDKFAIRVGFPQLMQKTGITEPASVLLAKFIGGVILLVFAILAMKALEMQAVEQLLEKFLLYLPNIFVALLILLTGYLLANFFGRAALIASVNSGVQSASFIGGCVKYTILILAATMALEHVGIGKETVVIAFAIIFGGIVLALALAFGLGGQEMAKDYLARKFKSETDREDDGIHHL